MVFAFDVHFGKSKFGVGMYTFKGDINDSKSVAEYLRLISAWIESLKEKYKDA